MKSIKNQMKPRNSLLQTIYPMYSLKIIIIDILYCTANNISFHEDIMIVLKVTYCRLDTVYNKIQSTTKQFKTGYEDII